MQDGDEAVLEEMAKIKSRLEAQKKKAVRRKRELQKKARIRAAQLASGEGLVDATEADYLFSLASIQVPRPPPFPPWPPSAVFTHFLQRLLILSCSKRS